MKRTGISFLILGFVLAACTISSKDDTPGDSAATVSIDPTIVPPMAIPMDSTALIDSTAIATGARIEVDLTARKLYFMKGSDSAGTYGVAVGSTEWPTRTGQWRITQVVWNPEWTPPDESWAEEREPRKPGDPKNPLGRTQLIYDPPRTVHGTNNPASIGKAVSHGSIRMRNEDIARLGRELMDIAGVGKDSAFYRNVRTNRTEKVIVDLPGGIPIRVF